jgi:thioredoxin:protein disulfide reductase
VGTVVLAVLLQPGIAWAHGSDTSGFSSALGRGSLVAIAVSFGSGLVASLTPCVFPMVPITVAIFGASESTSRLRSAALSATFALGVAALFVPMGMTFALSGKLMGSALSSPLVGGFIALVFAVLAASMFGAFEMTLPARLNNRLALAGGLGFRGAFVVGLAMGLIAAPCTGPFMTGMVLWISTTKSIALGGSAMFAFAMGLSVPFFIAGTFAVAMPKGGAWMIGVKWLSGVVLAGFSIQYAAKTFPVALGFLIEPSDTWVWVGLVLLTLGLVAGGLHVLGERRRSSLQVYSTPLKLLSILPAVSGLSLAMNGGASLVWQTLSDALGPPTAMACSAPPTAPPVAWSSDEVDAARRAQAEGRPMILDFGATWCAACAELEKETWPDPCFRSEAARYVAVKIDGTDDESAEWVRLSQKYAPIAGLPVVIVVDSQGKEAARYTEFVSAEELVAVMSKVK